MYDLELSEKVFNMNRVLSLLMLSIIMIMPIKASEGEVETGGVRQANRMAIIPWVDPESVVRRSLLKPLLELLLEPTTYVHFKDKPLTYEDKGYCSLLSLQKDGWWYYLDKEGYIKAAFWNDSDEALEHESKRLWFIKYLIEKRDEENALVISFVRDLDILDLDLCLVD